MSGVRSLLSHRYTVRAAQLATGVIMGWAALAKLVDLQAFALQVHNFRVLPIAAENLVAMSLPWVELVVALALVVGFRARAGAVVSVTLLSVFTVAVIAAVARGLDIECGCFGTSDASRVGLAKIGQNLVFVGIAALATLRPGEGRLAPESRVASSPGVRTVSPEF